MNANPPTTDTSSAAPQGNGARLARLNSPLFLWPATVGFAVLLYFALFYLNSFLTHESTDDAFIEAHVVSVAPRVAGQVLAVHVLDNQLVRSNDLLVEIDPADYAMTAAQKQSAADAQESSYKLLLHRLVRADDEGVHRMVKSANRLFPFFKVLYHQPFHDLHVHLLLLHEPQGHNGGTVMATQDGDPPERAKLLGQLQ